MTTEQWRHDDGAAAFRDALVAALRAGGVTLIEFAISLAVLSLVVGLALPSFSAWMRNQAIRAGAESVLSMAQLARAEAIKRNRPVVFAALGSPVPAGAGGAWIPDYRCDGTSLVVFTRANDGTVEVIDSRPVAEGAVRAAFSASTPGTVGCGAVQFNALGRADVAAGAVAAFDVVNAGIDAPSCVADGKAHRCLRVVVPPSGGARMCDPAAKGSGDTRAC